ncbi:MAG: histone deacetylase [bacterium]|nr:histone deacetylase [bacterium]
MEIKIAYNTKDYLHNDSNHVENNSRTNSIINYLIENLNNLNQNIFKANLINENNIKNIEDKIIYKLYKLTHTEEYIENILLLSKKIKGLYNLDPDTYFNENTLNVINTNIKLLINLVEELIEDKIKYGIGYIRPPGHHAEKDKAMGFCIINNVAVIANYLKEFIKLKKIAIIDFDAHHGNGTEDIFKTEKNTLFFSTHAYPFYPFTGFKSNIEYNKFNYPLNILANDEDLLNIYESELEKIITNFNPEFVIISMGYDIHLNDPITYMRVTDNGIDKLHKTLINKLKNYKTLWVLEGGYNLEVLQYSSLNLINNIIKKN